MLRPVDRTPLDGPPAEAIQAQRAEVLDTAYAAHPERFVRKPPTPPQLPNAAWINKPKGGHP